MITIGDYLRNYNKKANKGACKACEKLVKWSRKDLGSHKRTNCPGVSTEEKKLFRRQDPVQASVQAVASDVPVTSMKISKISTVARNCCACDAKPGNIKICSSSLLTKMFQDSTGLEVKNDYGLCESCQQDLKMCYNFRKQCLEIHSLYEDSSPSIEEVFVQSANNLVKKEPYESVACSSDGEDNMEVYNNLDDGRSADFSTLDDEHNADENNRFQSSDYSTSFSDNSAFLNHLNNTNFVCHRSQSTSAYVISRPARHLRSAHNGFETFKTTQQMTKHKALEHGEGDKFICDICAKVFFSRAKLISHQKYHRTEKKMYTSCPSTFTKEKG